MTEAPLPQATREFIEEDGIEYVATPYGPKRIFKVPVSEDRTLEFHELTPHQFEVVTKSIKPDSTSAGWDMITNALQQSVVRIDGRPVTYADVMGDQFRDSLTVRQMMLIRSVWEDIHMPAEDMVAHVRQLSPRDTEWGKAYTLEVSDERLVVFAELSVAEFEGVLRSVKGDDPMAMSIEGLGRSVVADRGQALERPTSKSELYNRFSLLELLTLRLAWDTIHMPTEEDLRRVKSGRA